MAVDKANNRRLRHYGPWYVSDPGLGTSGGIAMVIVDGVLDIAHGEWLPEFHLLDEDVRTASQAAQLFANWDADDFFLGWQGSIWSLDGEAWFLFDTGPGGATVAGVQVLVDAVAPEAAIERPAVSPVLVGGRALVVTGRAFDSSPANGRLNDVEVQLDGGPWGAVDRLLRQEDGSYTWTWRWSLPSDEEGVSHTLSVRAVDAAGNVGEPSASVEVIVDTIAPTTAIAYPADGTWLEPGATQVVVWGWTEEGYALGRVEVSLDGGLTWAEAMLAVEEMEDGTVLEPPSAIS